MLTLALFKMKMSLLLAWLKKNWKVVSIFAAIVAIMAFQMISKRRDDKVIRDLEKQLELARKDYDKANQLHREELLRRARIEEQYKKVISDLEIKYGETIAKLDRQKQQQIREIVAQTHDDPKVMAERINTTLGIPLYHRGETP